MRRIAKIEESGQGGYVSINIVLRPEMLADSYVPHSCPGTVLEHPFPGRLIKVQLHQIMIVAVHKL